MTATIIASLAFLSILSGTAIGLFLGKVLPEHHLSTSTKDVVRLSMGMIATMTALVLGLVTASAKSSFDAEDAAVKHIAATVLSLDRMLADYGAEAKPIRDAMRDALMSKVDEIWHGTGQGSASYEPGLSDDRIADDLIALAPTTPKQEWYRSRALELAAQVLESRWVIFTGTGGSVPTLFLVVIICWLTVLFGSFALFAPRNTTTFGALLICSVSVALSIFLILEMDDPFGGVMRISDAPLRYALSEVDH